jgi:protein-S-isoprenylcysteine O-methyltransferase Ste14
MSRIARPEARSWTQQRVRMALPLGIAYVWLAQPTPVSLALGAAVALVGLLVRGAAASSLPKHEALVTSGPYAFTRHPLYFGSALMASGFAIAGGSWVVALLGAAYFMLFYPGAMKREEEKLRARYGSRFDDYAARVPRFWPRVMPLRAAHFAWSWKLYRRNGEYQAAIGLLVGFGLLWLKCSGATVPLLHHSTASAAVSPVPWQLSGPRRG